MTTYKDSVKLVETSRTEEPAGTRYTLTTSEITIHRQDRNFSYGELNTTIRLEDETGGAFVVLHQSDSTTPGEIRLDIEEIELIAQAAKTLLSQPSINP